MPSNRQSILDTLHTRLTAIQTAAGFETNAGSAVYFGETVQLGEDDPEVAIALVVGEDEPSYQGEQILINLPVFIQALAKATSAGRLDTAYVAAEAVLGDIKRAIELSDRTLGGYVKRQIRRGTTRTIAREPGSTTVGVSIAYLCPYTEVFGDP